MFQLMYDGFVLLSLLPFFPFFITWLIGRGLLKPKKRAIKLAMDITTVFLIASVGGLYNTLFDSKAGFYWILFFLLIAAGLIGGLQQQKYGRWDPRKMIRVIWRITFFLLSVLYVFLLLIGIIIYSASM